MSSRRHALRSPARAAWRLALILALIAVTAFALGAGIQWLQTGVLSMFPAIALAIVLLTRRYPGERVIGALRSRRTARPSPGTLMRTPSRPPTRIVRGGRLIAAALAGRAPPRPLAGWR
jgi:hypothetical protein